MAALPEPTDLVEAAMAALGATTEDELRDELRRRYGLAPSQGTINRWRNGKRSRGPSYEFALALLDIAGWLSKDAGGQSAPPAPADPLGALAVAVGKLALTQAAIADSLGVPRADVELPPTPRSRQRGTSTGRRRRAG